MDKQKAKKAAKSKAIEFEMALGDKFEVITLEVFNYLIDRLDEPQFSLVSEEDYIQQIKELVKEVQELQKEVDEKGEPEKVVVPDFVGEFIEECKEENIDVFIAYNRARIYDVKAKKWIMINPVKFARAWLDGWKVEEKKYEVKDKNDCFLLTKNSEGEVINAYSKVVYKNKGQLTEQEIKDYDERFWAFAVPVEEGADE